jgi:streptogramin lyase
MDTPPSVRRYLCGLSVTALSALGLVSATPAVAQTHVNHAVTQVSPPIATKITERQVRQQCCIVNQVNGQPVKELAGPIDIIASHGSLWFTENQGYINRSFDPNTTLEEATLEDVAIGRIQLNGDYTWRDDLTKHSQPHFLVTGPDKIYFTEVRGDRVGSFRPLLPDLPIQEHVVGADRTPAPMIIGPDGDPWFGEIGFDFASSPPEGDRVGAIRRFDPETGAADPDNTFISGFASFPTGMAADSEGDVWFTEFVLGNVARLTPATGTITRFSGNGGPSGIIEGADDNIWFAERSAGRIACIADGVVHHYDLGSVDGVSKEPARMIRGPGFGLVPTSRRGIWFSEVRGNALGQIQGSCGVDPLPLVEWKLPAYEPRAAHPEDDDQSPFPPSPSRNPFGLVYNAATHSIYFTEVRTSSIGRLRLD